MKETLVKRLLAIVKRWRTPSAQLSLLPPLDNRKQSAGPPKSTGESKPDLVPGNFLAFEFFIELKLRDQVHLGYPKVPTRNMMTKLVRWGSKLEWSWPDPSKARVPWIDDEQRGVAQRTLESVEDVLGAEGTIGGKLMRFEKILDLGQNQVVYALHCPAQNFRIAYGFDRLIFEPSYIRTERSGLHGDGN
jgi:hypothetical protein